MANNEIIVRSAVASFNNSALAGADFLLTGILMLPLFFMAWKASAEILAWFFPSKKSRNYNFAWLTEALLAAWLVFNCGNWAALRDGVGFLPYIDAILLFVLCKDAAARLVEQNPKLPKWWRKIEAPFKKWLKLGTLLFFVAVLGGGALQEFHFIALHVTSALFGVAAGYFSRRSAPPVGVTVFAMTMASLAILVQPEFFRFGQMGRLTFAHLAFLAAVMGLGALIFAFGNFKPAGFIKDNHYRYVKWFMRLSALLAFILFVMTEAVPAFIALGIGVAATTWFAVKHLPRESSVSGLVDNLWAAMLVLFGLVSAIPVIAAVGILCWRNNNMKSFWRDLLDALQ